MLFFLSSFCVGKYEIRRFPAYSLSQQFWAEDQISRFISVHLKGELLKDDAEVFNIPCSLQTQFLNRARTYERSYVICIDEVCELRSVRFCPGSFCS